MWYYVSIVRRDKQIQITKEEKAQSDREGEDNNLQDFDLGRVCGADVEALEVWFKHPL